MAEATNCKTATFGQKVYNILPLGEAPAMARVNGTSKCFTDPTMRAVIGTRKRMNI